MAKKSETTVIEKRIVVPEIEPQMATITIIGDSDLIINKMNDVTKRILTGQRNNEAIELQKSNVWEEIITSIHWLNAKPIDFSQKGLEKALKENSPCISAFGLKKQLNKAVVRNKIDTYSTNFDAAVSIIPKGDNLIPIKFAEHFLDEKLMQPKKGKPVLARLNRFSGWSAEFNISYMDKVFSLPGIITIINLTGFGIGIGSGITSGYGRFHVENVKAI